MLLYIDGVGHYATDEIDKKWTTVDSTDGTWAVIAEGRFNNALKKTYTSTSANFGQCGYVETAPLMTQSGVWTPTASGVCGFAYRVNDLSYVYNSGQVGAEGFALFSLRDGPEHVMSVTLNDSGTMSLWLQAYDGSTVNTVLKGSSVQGLRSNVWAFLEFKWLIHASAGSFEIRMNGVSIFTYSGALYPSGLLQSYTGTWNAARVGSVPADSTSLRTWLCDYYLLDLTGIGSQLRDFLGDVTIDYIVPDGVGNSSGWTPLSGANWTNVEEVPPDEDTTYVSATTVNTRDSYTMQNVPAGTEPLGFQTLIYARKETEGGASLKPTYREGITNYDSNTQGIATPDEYRYIIQPYDTNPATSVTITEAEINAAEFGVLKVV